MSTLTSAESVAKLLGVPVENVRKQYRKNAAQLRQMADNKPERRGFTREHLIVKVKEFESK